MRNPPAGPARRTLAGVLLRKVRRRCTEPFLGREMGREGIGRQTVLSLRQLGALFAHGHGEFVSFLKGWHRHHTYRRYVGRGIARGRAAASCSPASDLLLLTHSPRVHIISTLVR